MYTNQCTYINTSCTVKDVTVNIVDSLDEMIPLQYTTYTQIPIIVLVIPDLSILAPLETLKDDTDTPMLTLHYSYAYNCDAPKDILVDMFHAQQDEISKLLEEKFNFNGYGYSSACRQIEQEDFFTAYGGLFFIGIMLSIVFIFAATMIIYYKQVSEGYEDQARFDIMRKVGMTKQDIRKSIEAQILTVFFAPLIMAGFHLAFAFPLIWKLLQLFGLINIKFIIIVTVVTFILFGTFYAIIYRLTAGAYYNIVSSDHE